MNKIILADDKTDITLDNIILENNHFTVSSSTKLLLKINKREENFHFNILNQVNLDLIIMLEDTNTSFTYDIGENSHVKVSVFGRETSGNVKAYLYHKNSSFCYHFSGINKNDAKWIVEVTHFAPNTTSEVQERLIAFSGSTLLDINGIVPKDSKECVCNQDNRIINLGTSECSIFPKLMIDNYDVIANHSAYVGKFSKEALFYLQSRGMNESESYNLLLKSFLFGTMTIEEEEKNLFYQEIENMEV